ncbi:MAG: VCBS repeat-containing protein [Saprospiraceae bacterium]|nr:VCBS repeat-containing protein [Saprospiraceae bacterium]
MFRKCIFFLFVIKLSLGFGQKKICSKTDTSNCLVNEKFISTKFEIEKKFESTDTVFTRQTPLLADMDGDCVPEFIVQEGNNQGILIVDTKTGLTKWRITTPYIDPKLTGMAIADVDEDGSPEIFIEAFSSFPNPGNIHGKLFSYHADGRLYWISDSRVDRYTHSRDEMGGTPALADFNQDGVPEIYVNNKIFNARTGIKLADGGANGIGTEIAIISGGEALTIAGHLDNDSTDLELAAGYTIYKVKITNLNGITGNIMTPNNIQIDNRYRDGYTT